MKTGPCLTRTYTDETVAEAALRKVGQWASDAEVRPLRSPFGVVGYSLIAFFDSEDEYREADARI
jgi:hypothetical protein